MFKFLGTVFVNPSEMIIICIRTQWAHDIRNVYVTFYKRSRNIPMSNVRKTFLERFWNVFRTLDIRMFLERL